MHIYIYIYIVSLNVRAGVRMYCSDGMRNDVSQGTFNELVFHWLLKKNRAFVLAQGQNSFSPSSVFFFSFFHAFVYIIFSSFSLCHSLAVCVSTNEHIFSLFLVTLSFFVHFSRSLCPSVSVFSFSWFTYIHTHTHLSRIKCKANFLSGV